MTHRSSVRAGAQLPVRLLAAMPENIQFESLRSAIGETGWAIFRTDTIADGLSTLINHKINVIVMNSHLEDGSWLEMIEALRPCRNAPRVLVASPHADHGLWLDVLEHGGYDLLTIPFDGKELDRVISLAYFSWERNIRGLSSAFFPTHASEHFSEITLRRQSSVEAGVGGR